MSEMLASEVWIVATKRRDGELPDPVKTYEHKLHFDKAQAFVALDQANHFPQNFGFGVFRCLLTVVEAEQ